MDFYESRCSIVIDDIFRRCITTPGPIGPCTAAGTASLRSTGSGGGDGKPLTPYASRR